MSKEKTQYTGEEIDVEWDGRLCIHIGECGQSAGDLFVGGRDPWCKPDLSSVDDVIDVVQRCPTGALTYQCKSAAIVEHASSQNSLTVSYNGPYFLRGQLEISAISDDMPGVEFRAALCRCGASSNKPFCDNSHEAAGFRDPGAVGEKGEVLENAAGPLKVTQFKDGPLLCEGNLTIRNGSGCKAWSGQQVALCRCGASSNKPFCDGSHMGIDFKAPGE